MLLLLKPPITTMRPQPPATSSSTASCRSCVALQMVSKLWNRSAAAASPWRRATAARSSSAISSDSEESMVVWFAHPIRSRWRSGSKPGECGRANRARKAARSSAPLEEVHRPPRASARSRTTRKWAPGWRVTCEQVARVSS